MMRRDRNEVITDERLDELAERFQRENLLRLLKVPFGHYVSNPEHYDRIARHLRSGGGLQGQTGLGAVRLVMPHVDPERRGLIVHTMN